MGFDWQSILMALPGIVIGLTVHEFMHAFAAVRLGDPTAREQGRLSLNPLRHIDPVGLLFLVFAGFGWAKPVRINRAGLRRPRRDEVLISLAGPAANLVLAILLMVAYRLVTKALPPAADPGRALQVFLEVFFYAIYINLTLFIFNLIPIPPLDGSHLIFAAVSVKPETEVKIYRYGSMAFLALLVLSMFLERAAGFGLFDWIPHLINWIVTGVSRMFILMGF